MSIAGIWQKIESRLTGKTLVVIWIISLLCCIAISFIMQPLWEEARFPADVFAMQLSFSSDSLRSGYQYMMDNGNIEAFRTWQLVDYGFMAAYGIFGITLALLAGRLYPQGSKNRTLSYYAATVMVIVPLLDACENLISLITLADPLGFPDALGSSHSLFALVKWALGGLAFLWALASLAYYPVFKSKVKKYV